jgi:dihydropteroate synthase
MIIERLSPNIDIKKYLEALGVDSGGVNILAAKSEIYLISIKNLPVGGANILKQDALSVGADLAVPRGTVVAATPKVDVLLIATMAQLLKLSKKELAQPFGLKNLAEKLKTILSNKSLHKREIMGIINANDDSFFQGSRFKESDAITKIEQMIEEGATIIDIGGVSSAPNAKDVTAEEELARIAPIADLISEHKLYERVKFSIDSYTPSVVEYAFESGFEILNDITGLQSDALCRLCAAYDATVVIMHMQGRPQTMQNNPQYENILEDIYNFLEQQIKKAEHFGIEKIILDVGIGFGKTLEDNLRLIKHLQHFLSLGKPLLVGASRKSMIGQIDGSSVDKRVAGTVALHLEALRNGASIVRVHDVQEHAQAIKVQNFLDKA